MEAEQPAVEEEVDMEAVEAVTEEVAVAVDSLAFSRDLYHNLMLLLLLVEVVVVLMTLPLVVLVVEKMVVEDPTVVVPVVVEHNLVEDLDLVVDNQDLHFKVDKVPQVAVVDITVVEEDSMLVDVALMVQGVVDRVSYLLHCLKSQVLVHQIVQVEETQAILEHLRLIEFLLLNRLLLKHLV